MGLRVCLVLLTTFPAPDGLCCLLGPACINPSKSDMIISDKCDLLIDPRQKGEVRFHRTWTLSLNLYIVWLSHALPSFFYISHILLLCIATHIKGSVNKKYKV